MSRLDRAVTAGLVTFVTFLWIAVLLLAAGWLADLFLAALPWSLGLYLAAAAAAAAASARGMATANARPLTMLDPPFQRDTRAIAAWLLGTPEPKDGLEKQIKPNNR